MTDPPVTTATAEPKDPRLIDAEIAREAAEVRKIDAEIAKLEEETGLAKLERATKVAFARNAEASATMAELLAADRVREDLITQADDYYHHVYTFDTDVSSVAVKNCMRRLSEWSRLDPTCAIELRLNSPGGSVVDGMALWDYLQTLKRQGHTLTTVAYGMAASMAGILLQAGDKRVMGAESYLLIHEGSFGAIGSVGEVEDRVEWVKKIHERILNIFADRSHLSVEEIRSRMNRKDWWLTSTEALELGFVDEVR